MATFDPSKLRPLRVAVLQGGESPEREISLQSGAAVTAALQECGHEVTPLDPLEVDLSTYNWDGIDVVFIALHGPFGEDGQIQRILDAAGMSYTGSSAATSQLSFQKSAAKECFFQNYVPTPPYVLIHEGDTAARIMHKARSLGFPLVVKPDAQGSSLGVSIVHTPEELTVALPKCFHLESFGLLESAIIGTEWTVGILDEITLPLIQVKPPAGFFDYHAKYENETTEYLFEFDLPADVLQSINQAARNAYTALKLRGLARIDLMLDKYQRPWVLEANTVPGLTSHSLVPKAAARVGIGLGDLCEQMLQRCLQPAHQH